MRPPWRSRSKAEAHGRDRSVADLHLVGDDVAVFVADRFDARDGETAVAQIVAGFLQGVVEIVAVVDLQAHAVLSVHNGFDGRLDDAPARSTGSP